MQPDIERFFSKYVGQEVAVAAETRVVTIAGKKITLEENRLADKDQPALQALRKDAERLGLTLRIWLPDTICTMELNPNRLNAHIRKSTDGKWRISDNMTIDASQKLRESFASVVARGVDEEITVKSPLKLKKPSRTEP